MIEHKYIFGRGRCQCDLCKSVKKPDSLVLITNDDGLVIGQLTLCFSCAEVFFDELGLPRESRPIGDILF